MLTRTQSWSVCNTQQASTHNRLQHTTASTHNSFTDRVTVDVSTSATHQSASREKEKKKHAALPRESPSEVDHGHAGGPFTVKVCVGGGTLVGGGGGSGTEPFAHLDRVRSCPIQMRSEAQQLGEERGGGEQGGGVLLI